MSIVNLYQPLPRGAFLRSPLKNQRYGGYGSAFAHQGTQGHGDALPQALGHCLTGISHDRNLAISQLKIFNSLWFQVWYPGIPKILGMIHQEDSMRIFNWQLFHGPVIDRKIKNSVDGCDLKVLMTVTIPMHKILKCTSSELLSLVLLMLLDLWFWRVN